MPRTHKTEQRLFVKTRLNKGKVIELDKGQSNYLNNVLCKKPGDKLVLFNGLDGAWLALVAAVSRKSVKVETIACFALQPPRNDLWYGFAPLQSGRLDYLVQKACEMGVGALQPIITGYSQIGRASCRERV